MRLGICGGLEIADRVREAGFDYLEVGASGFSTREDFDPVEYRRAGAEASNLFFPGAIKLTGSEATPYREYIETAVARAAEIGLAVIVIGSGGSRRAPEGVSVEEAERRFVEVAAEVQDLARLHGIPVAPESLNRSETNVGNDLPSLAQALRDHGVAFTADSYHVLYEWKANGGTGTPSAGEWAEQIPFLPAHVHVSNLERKAPAADDPMLHGFFARLRDLGYRGRVSLEASLPDFTVETLRRAREALVELTER